MMVQAYREAFVEVEYFLQMMPEELLNKVSKKFIKFISENKDVNYKFNVKNGFKKESEAILAIIYKDYICSEEERKLLIIEKEQEERNIINGKVKIESQNQKNVKQNIIVQENLENVNLNENKALIDISKKERWYKRFIKFFKKIFRC